MLTADRANLIERLLKRTFCEKCNLTFAENLYCCNQLVGKRSDDTVTTFLKRLDVFYKDFDQILIELIGPIYFINTQHTIDQILITMDQIISK